MRLPERSRPGSDKLAKLTWPSLKKLLSLAKPHKGSLALASSLTIVTTFITLSYALVGRQAINHVLETKLLAELDRYVLLFILLIAAASALSFVQHMITARVGNRIVMDLRLRLFEHLERLPVAFFDRHRSGDLTSHMSTDIAQLQSTLTEDLVKAASNALTVIGGIIIAISIDWKLSLAVVLVLAIAMAFFIVSGRALRKLNRQVLDALSEANGSITESLSNIRLVKAFAREPYESNRLAEAFKAIFKLQMRSEKSTAMMGVVGTSGFAIVLLGVIWYGGRRVLDGSLQISDLFAFFMTITVLSGPMASLGALYTRLQRAVGASDRVFELLAEAPEPDEPSSTCFPTGPGRVEFADVSFSYVAGVPVLENFNLTLQPGEVTALVGPSGSGKSTVSSLLYRFYEPQAGHIEIDGVPIRSISKQTLRENIGIVPQDPILFSGTLSENIRYGRLDATDAELLAAAKAAHVDEFASQLPDGYATAIGERGVTLSGGQRQRVAIARALLKNPRILVLDEATSALDHASEALVIDALETLMQGRTTLVIAHRESTIRRAQNVVSLSPLGTPEPKLPASLPL